MCVCTAWAISWEAGEALPRRLESRTEGGCTSLTYPQSVLETRSTPKSDIWADWAKREAQEEEPRPGKPIRYSYDLRTPSREQGARGGGRNDLRGVRAVSGWGRSGC